MTDDFDDDLDEGQEPTEGSDAQPQDASQLPDWAQKEITKAREEAKSLRVKFRRSELSGEFGKDVMELVPDSLPLKEQKALAEKLHERFKTEPSAEPDQEPKATKEEGQEPPSEEESKLATLNDGSQGGAPSKRTYTGPEMHEAYRKGELTNDDIKRILEDGLVTKGDPGVTYH